MRDAGDNVASLYVLQTSSRISSERVIDSAITALVFKLTFILKHSAVLLHGT